MFFELVILKAYKVQEGGLLKSHQSLTSSNFKNFDIWLKLSKAVLPSQSLAELPTQPKSWKEIHFKYIESWIIFYLFRKYVDLAKVGNTEYMYAVLYVKLT